VVERATRADTLAEACAVAWRMRCAASSVVAQEWIDGNDDDIYFTLFVCDGQARIVALFTGHKMICDPPLVGTTALCVAATEEHQTLAAQTQAFVTNTHYHGIGGLEFKRNRRTGQFVVVEPTRRSHRLAGRNRNFVRREHSGHRVPDSARRARRVRRTN
jgi:D-aspartate ligase